MPTSDKESTDQTLAPTPVSQWRRGVSGEGFVVQLPTGNVVRMRRSVDFWTMLKHDRIPNPLGEVLREHIQAMGKKELVMEDLDPQAIPQLLAFVDEIDSGCVLEPRWEMPYVPIDDSSTEKQRAREWQPSEGALSIEEVDLLDKYYVFRVAIGGAADMASFLAESKQAMAGTQYGQDLREGSSGAAGDS